MHEEIRTDGQTRFFEVAVTETRTSYVTVEVPIDASEQDQKLLNELVLIPGDSSERSDDVQMDISESCGPAEFRLDLHDKRWHVTPLNYETRSRQRLADGHQQLVRSLKDSDELEFNRVNVELPDERIVAGCVYYRPGYSIVVAVDESLEEEYLTGILRGFDHCLPTFGDTGSIPWEVVDDLNESEPIGVFKLLDRAAMWVAKLDPKLRAKRQPLVPGLTITHPTPRRAVDSNELYCRFQRSSDAPDVTG